MLLIKREVHFSHSKDVRSTSSAIWIDKEVAKINVKPKNMM